MMKRAFVCVNKKTPTELCKYTNHETIAPFPSNPFVKGSSQNHVYKSNSTKRYFYKNNQNHKETSSSSNSNTQEFSFIKEHQKSLEQNGSSNQEHSILYSLKEQVETQENSANSFFTTVLEHLSYHPYLTIYSVCVMGTWTIAFFRYFRIKDIPLLYYLKTKFKESLEFLSKGDKPPEERRYLRNVRDIEERVLNRRELVEDLREDMKKAHEMYVQHRRDVLECQRKSRQMMVNKEVLKILNYPISMVSVPLLYWFGFPLYVTMKYVEKVFVKIYKSRRDGTSIHSSNYHEKELPLKILFHLVHPFKFIYTFLLFESALFMSSLDRIYQSFDLENRLLHKYLVPKEYVKEKSYRNSLQEVMYTMKRFNEPLLLYKIAKFYHEEAFYKQTDQKAYHFYSEAIKEIENEKNILNSIQSLEKHIEKMKLNASESKINERMSKINLNQLNKLKEEYTMIKEQKEIILLLRFERSRLICENLIKRRKRFSSQRPIFKIVSIVESNENRNQEGSVKTSDSYPGILMNQKSNEKHVDVGWVDALEDLNKALKLFEEFVHEGEQESSVSPLYYKHSDKYFKTDYIREGFDIRRDEQLKKDLLNRLKENKKYIQVQIQYEQNRFKNQPPYFV